MDLAKLSRREDVAWQKKMQWRSLLELCYMFAMPGFNPFDPTIGTEKLNGQVFDSAAATSTSKSVNRIIEDIMPAGRHAGNIIAGPAVPVGDARRRVSSVTKALSASFFSALRSSNFDAQFGPFMMDSFGAGTALMTRKVDKDTGSFKFMTVPQNQYALEDDDEGRNSGVFRKYKPLISNIESIWPDAKIPNDLQKKAKEDATKRVLLSEIAVMDGDAYRYYVLWSEGEKTGKKFHVLVEREVKRNSFLTSRWFRVSGEVQGRSQLMSLLPDVRLLSQVKKLMVQNATMQMNGAWLVHSAGLMAPNSRIGAGKQIPVRYMNAGGRKPIERLEVGGDLGVAEFMSSGLKEDIRNGLNDNGLPPMADGIRSPTEIIERVRDMQLQYGPQIGRLTTEFIYPLVEGGISDLDESGAFKQDGIKEVLKQVDIDPSRIKIDNTVFKFESNSQLVRSAQYQEVQTFMEGHGYLVQVGGEEYAQAVMKMEEVPNWIFDRIGGDTGLLKSPEDVKEFLSKAAQASAVAQEQGPEAGIEALSSNAA